METPHKYSFDELPNIMANLVNQVQDLKYQVQSLKERTLAAPVVQKETEHRAMSTNEVAVLLHKKPITVYRMVAAGKIPCYKQGKTLIFFRDEIYDWISVYRKGTAEEVFNAAEEYCSINPL